MEKKRRRFYQISPLTYKISVFKCTMLRHLANRFTLRKFASTKFPEPLPHLIYAHKSLIRRKQGTLNPKLQDNKAVNLKLAAAKISHVLIEPRETFSLWKLVGSCTARKGYLDGLVISNGKLQQGTAGGLCQLSNLIHWMILHTPMDITEHHHHDGFDWFPDHDRQVPFGCGTSIHYNYLDYQFRNVTRLTFQLIVYTTDDYLCGELRTDDRLSVKYDIEAEDEFFSEEDGIVYRNSNVYRTSTNTKTRRIIQRELLKTNHAQVMYDTTGLSVVRKNAEV